MADILNTISIISFILFGLFAILSVVYCIVLKIPAVVGDLTGRTARKSIEQMRKNNEDTANNPFGVSRKTPEHIKPVGAMESVNSQYSHNRETGLLKENMKRDHKSESTGVLDFEPGRKKNGKTVSLDMDIHTETVGRKPPLGSMKIIDEVVAIHTEEVI